MQIDCRYFSVIISINQSCVASGYSIYVCHILCAFSQNCRKMFLKTLKTLSILYKNAQNLYLSISKFSRDSRHKIPGSPGMKKGRESREFPRPGIPGAELYLKVLELTWLTLFRQSKLYILTLYRLSIHTDVGFRVDT